MFEFFKNIFSKKNNKKMDTERLINLKENFTGQSFQWVKTKDENLLGKVVKCKDIQPKGRSFIAIFNDGSSIPTDNLNRNLMMITEGMQPLSKSEVRAIAGPPTPAPNSSNSVGPMGDGPISIPKELQDFKTPPVNPSSQKQAPPLNSQSTISTSASSSSSNMFSMFNTEDTSLNIAFSIKLPSKKLLKMMYQNADDKQKFLTDLSEYVHVRINKDIVKNSLEKILVPTSKKTKPESQDETEITATEVNEK